MREQPIISHEVRSSSMPCIYREMSSDVHRQAQAHHLDGTAILPLLSGSRSRSFTAIERGIEIKTGAKTSANVDVNVNVDDDFISDACAGVRNSDNSENSETLRPLLVNAISAASTSSATSMMMIKRKVSDGEVSSSYFTEVQKERVRNPSGPMLEEEGEGDLPLAKLLTMNSHRKMSSPPPLKGLLAGDSRWV